MSLLRIGVTKSLGFLTLFSLFALAQISAPNCTVSSYAWTFNSVGQNPCAVTAYMMGTCDGGLYTLSPLQPGYKYHGPRGSDNSNLCECSTVGYSLFSACTACQGQVWITWSEWVTNCTKTLPPGSFPNPVPSGIRVPQWALLDVTNENRWNANKSYSVGDNPEVPPGTTIGPSSASAARTTSASSSTAGSSTTSSSASPTTTILVGHSLNAGAIAGGVVGGVAAISITVALVFLYLRRRSREPSAVFDVYGEDASPPYHVDNTSRPLSDTSRGAVVTPPLSGSPVTMRLYDPNDPTTFPGYPGPQSPDRPPQGPTSLQIGSSSGSTLTATQASSLKGYQGLPMPTA